MKRNKYTWKGPERIIPGEGLAETGKPIELPVVKGDKLVAQGLATKVKQARDTKRAASNEEV